MLYIVLNLSRSCFFGSAKSAFERYQMDPKFFFVSAGRILQKYLMGPSCSLIALQEKFTSVLRQTNISLKRIKICLWLYLMMVKALDNLAS